jgi:hypothetical protein
VKRSALGRLKHEGAWGAGDARGKVVMYMGDDEQFECIYRGSGRTASCVVTSSLVAAPLPADLRSRFSGGKVASRRVYAKEKKRNEIRGRAAETLRDKNSPHG